MTTHAGGHGPTSNIQAICHTVGRIAVCVVVIVCAIVALKMFNKGSDTHVISKNIDANSASVTHVVHTQAQPANNESSASQGSNGDHSASVVVNQMADTGGNILTSLVNKHSCADNTAQEFMTTLQPKDHKLGNRIRVKLGAHEGVEIVSPHLQDQALKICPAGHPCFANDPNFHFGSHVDAVIVANDSDQIAQVHLRCYPQPQPVQQDAQQPAEGADDDNSGEQAQQ